MANNDSHFSEHEIFDTLANLKSFLKSAESPDDAPIEDLDKVSRVSHFTDYVDRALAEADPLLVPLSNLNEISKRLQSVQAEVSRYFSNGNSGHLTNTVSHFKSCIGFVRQLIPIDDRQDVESVREIIQSFRKSIGQLLRHLEADVKSVDSTVQKSMSELEELRKQVEEQESAAGDLAVKFRRQFSEEQGKRGSVVDKKLSELEERIQEIIESSKSAQESDVAHFMSEF